VNGENKPDLFSYPNLIIFLLKSSEGKILDFEFWIAASGP
jgi:hypothetical protein